METRIALIGFGEAGQAFATGLAAPVAAYDCKTGTLATREAKWLDYTRLGVHGCESVSEALDAADAVLSLVTADQALVAAEAADGLAPAALWFDMNSVAPQTKRRVARAIEARGGRYVDVAVMAPVLPAGMDAPLLASGPFAEAGAARLRDLGFGNVGCVDGPVGAASAVKMVRSVMVKGIEALSAECALAADAAGVRDAVIASLDASWPGAGWEHRFDYNLDRMLVHGTRRSAEMEEVIATLDSLGTGSTMSRAVLIRQREMGALGLAPPDGLDAKLAAIRLDPKAQAA